MTVRMVRYDDLTDADRASVTFWGELEQETLHHEELDDAIEERLEYDGDLDGEITMAGFVRMPLDEGRPDPAWLLELALENLDEDFRYEGEPSEPTQAMQEAAKAFVEVVRREYVVWSCEDVLHVLVPIRAWTEKNAPDWIAEREAATQTQRNAQREGEK